MTRGDGGALVVAGDRNDSVPAHEATVVDATGAGDCVAGVIAAALAAGVAPAKLRPAMDVAMRAAAGVVEVWGATAGLPEAAEAQAQLAAALSS